ncbi:aldehyde dehydrogenase family protein [Pseudorhizobium flavum]|uniref:Acyl-CoA reductase-like NAD-dependent aldehyde dehydrogenase n=1 Tax=Pseudorhizobium flavum TaxID=1335061 RepID=A0A7W9Z1H7_9HYPH|nr:aldehyde dehydrogenase family protein [Pseudorhizobium flavum]MBB6182310.1 acyl-CoA reductase-like NAD-dependent aldehyde dehydrogenase [Pseudorhizobium flavum]CAD6629445.1 aldehyde dehydrogenase [Pseudorhizobium flavum]
MASFETITPIDDSVLLTRERHTDKDVDTALARASKTFSVWRSWSLARRIEILEKAVAAFVGQKESIAAEITTQMGRPIAYSGGEVAGFETRARTMLRLAPEALQPFVPSKLEGFDRSIKRAPLGVVAVLAPWNYPFLTAVNAVIPALAAGNVVVLKHSDQTPLAAERMDEAFRAVGLPDGVFQFLHIDHDQVARMIADPRVSYVCFTGSVGGGHAVQRALSGSFTSAGLELGGKDPAYVREDANIEHAIANIADGIFFNSGQSCCGIERVYVHERHYKNVVDGLVAYAEQLSLGDPRDAATTLGPMVKTSAANSVRAQISDAVRAGAHALVDGTKFSADTGRSAYLSPQIIVDCDHSMSIMAEETFGPVAGVMSVRSDEEAVRLMNDSRYGLTASVWTADSAAAERIGDQLETGTVFMNRCDYLDPELAWTGVKDSGRGATLSRLGYDYLTRPKSYHFRLTV